MTDPAPADAAPPDVLPYTPFPRPLRRLRSGPIRMPELPSVLLASSEVGCHAVPRSSRLTKKSLVSDPGAVVNTPSGDCW